MVSSTYLAGIRVHLKLVPNASQLCKKTHSLELAANVVEDTLFVNLVVIPLQAKFSHFFSKNGFPSICLGGKLVCFRIIVRFDIRFQVKRNHSPFLINFAHKAGLRPVIGKSILNDSEEV